MARAKNAALGVVVQNLVDAADGELDRGGLSLCRRLHSPKLQMLLQLGPNLSVRYSAGAASHRGRGVELDRVGQRLDFGESRKVGRVGIGTGWRVGSECSSQIVGEVAVVGVSIGTSTSLGAGMLVHGLSDGLADGVGHALGHCGKHGLSPWGGDVGVVRGGAVKIVLIVIVVSHE